MVCFGRTDRPLKIDHLRNTRKTGLLRNLRKVRLKYEEKQTVRLQTNELILLSDMLCISLGGYLAYIGI